MQKPLSRINDFERLYKENYTRLYYYAYRLYQMQKHVKI